MYQTTGGRRDRLGIQGFWATTGDREERGIAYPYGSTIKNLLRLLQHLKPFTFKWRGVDRIDKFFCSDLAVAVALANRLQVAELAVGASLS